MNDSPLRARVPAIVGGRTGVVLSVALVIWGLTLFDLTLLPRNPLSYLPVYPPERLVGVRVSPQATVLTSASPVDPNGPWILTPQGPGVRVVGAKLPSFHNPKRPDDGRFKARLRTNVPDLRGSAPIDVDVWSGGSPALFAVDSPRRDTTLDVYPLDGESRPLLSAKPPLPAQRSDRRDFAIARWSGPLPDLFVVDRDAQRRQPLREPSFRPWSIRVYSGESAFERQILRTLIRPKLSRRLSKYDWWVDVGPRHRKEPDIVLVTRERKTGSNRTEIHLLAGAKKFRDFSIHAATELPQRVGPARRFVFQPDRQGGSVLMLKEDGGELSVRAMPLP